ncbi:C40 family peptidase [Nocardioides panzhihuensis]|uniref:Cell wall-associated NlpC family hydrolase n=1 Tax=Nocardioides panzhihuensis TaxID=860243 RepID=A0A7Z0DRX6_9ACTN|nr:C40 family peptidase [Nocardioides panzhihuensis]NYI80609.1 cell wall-associated NlpC family hydrolase [Nocardioides panzhihuensis]
MIGSCIRALSRAPRKISRKFSIGAVTALVVGLALVAVPTHSATATATATAPPGTSAQAGAHPASTVESTSSTTTEKATEKKAKKKKKSRGIKALRRAKSRAGAPYAYGGDGPHSFDCSGLTQWVYKKLGRKLPHSSSGQVGHTFKVKKPRKGDLVFFYGSSGVYHVGIYAGKRDGRRWIWHSPRSGETVQKDPIWTDSHFIRRVKYGKKR